MSDDELWITCIRAPRPDTWEDFEAFHKAVPGFPWGLCITASRQTQTFSSKEEYEEAYRCRPWSVVSQFDVFTRDWDADMFALSWLSGWFVMPTKLRHSKTEWYRDALDTFVAKIKYATSPRVLAKYRERYVRTVGPCTFQVVFNIACNSLAALRDAPPAYHGDVELQFLLWAKQFTDWHKQWVKAGRPLNME